MKKVILFLILSFFILNCELETSGSRAYDGVWLLDAAVPKTLTLDNGSFTLSSTKYERGIVSDIDSNTFTLRYTHIQSGGEWFTYTEAGEIQPEDVTKDWILSPGGNILTLTDPNNVDPDEVYTKQ